MSSGKGNLELRRPAVVDVDCGCGGKNFYSSFFPKSKSKPRDPYFSPSTTTIATNFLWEPSSLPSAAATTSTSGTATTTAGLTISSPVFLMPSPTARRSRRTSSTVEKKAVTIESEEEEKKKSAAGTKKGSAAAKRRLENECVAVMKESSEPYADFRESMLQMILEMDISAWEDLRALLRHYLDLNAPIHHPLIIRAFIEVWHARISAAATAAATAAAADADASSPSSPASTSSLSGSSTSGTPLRQ